MGEVSLYGLSRSVCAYSMNATDRVRHGACFLSFDLLEFTGTEHVPLGGRSRIEVSSLASQSNIYPYSSFLLSTDPLREVMPTLHVEVNSLSLPLSLPLPLSHAPSLSLPPSRSLAVHFTRQSGYAHSSDT